MYAIWQSNTYSYRPDITQIEHNHDLPDDFLAITKKHWGISTPCILNFPHAKGHLTLRSSQPNSFSPTDIEFLEQVIAVISISISRIEDLEIVEKTRLKHEAMVNSIDGIVWEADAKTFEFTFVSKQAERLLGYPVQQWQNEKDFWKNHIHPDDRDWAIAFCQQATTENRNHEFEYRMQTANGNYIWLHDIVSVISQGERPVLVQGVMIDVTKRKEMEQELIRIQRLNAVRELSAGICHNLNNILVGVVGPAQLLQMTTKNPEALEEIENILNAGLRAKELVHRLHLSTRGLDDMPCATNLNTVVEQAVQITRPRWKDQCEALGKVIQVHTQLQPLPNVLATQSGLLDVVVNLIFNAVDAMPQGGEIIISTTQNNNQALLTIKDTGIGMSESVQAKIFEPFFTTKKTVGTGLGLSTTYKAIHSWQGQIEVISAPNQGTTFAIWLHLQKNTAKTT
jgi:two-component system cell cycle sensor histidine kinase/response regulator CckA